MQLDHLKNQEGKGNGGYLVPFRTAINEHVTFIHFIKKITLMFVCAVVPSGSEVCENKSTTGLTGHY